MAMNYLYRTQKVIAIVVIAFCLQACGNDSSGASAIYSSDGEQALDRVSDYAIGTWTYTEPNPYWFRLIVAKDGSATYFSPRPTSDSWGSPLEGRIYPWTDKDGSTGERYYGFSFKTEPSDVGIQFLVNPKGGLINMTERKDMTRGDAFPFSK